MKNKTYGFMSDKGFFVGIGSKKATRSYMDYHGHKDDLVEAPKGYYSQQDDGYNEDWMMYGA